MEFIDFKKEIFKEEVAEKFKTQREVRQDCSLSLTLFIIGLNDLEIERERNNERETVFGKTKK